MPGQILVAGPYQDGRTQGVEVGDLTDAEFDILHGLVSDLPYDQVLKLPRPAEVQSDGGILEVPLRPTLIRRSRLWNDNDLRELAERWAAADEMSGEYRAGELALALAGLRKVAGPLGATDDVRLVFGTTPLQIGEDRLNDPTDTPRDRTHPQGLPRDHMMLADKGPFWQFLLPAGWKSTSRFYENAGQVVIDPHEQPGSHTAGRVVIAHYYDLGLHDLDDAVKWSREADAGDVASGALLSVEASEAVAARVGGRDGRFCSLTITLPSGQRQRLEQWITLGRRGGLLRVDAYQPWPEDVTLGCEPTLRAHVIGEHVAATISWRGC